MEQCRPQYNESLVSLISSITAHFGAGAFHDTLPAADELLSEQPKNVILMIFDGMGEEVLSRCLPQDSFLRSHRLCGLSSVFPPTTVAAVTSLYSGLTPAEHGWLGWSSYFPWENLIVDAFTNRVKDTEKPAAPYSVARRYLPYESVFSRIRTAGFADAHEISAFGDTRTRDFDDIFRQAAAMCAGPGRKYLYCYWGEPDICQHQEGCCCESCRRWCLRIDEACRSFCESVKDTLVFVAADHGHRAVKYRILSEYPKLTAMCQRPTAIEPRATAFFVKPGCVAGFPDAFYEAFGREDFLLLSKAEVLESRLFGFGCLHPALELLLGDYTAVAVGDRAIVWDEKSRRFPSHHAGLTESEMRVPLIAVSV